MRLVNVALLILLLGLFNPALAKEDKLVAEAVELVAVNINSASAKELAKTLKGVGLSRAKAIVEYREKFGKFVAIEQLTEIKGIGNKTIEENRALIKLE